MLTKIDLCSIALLKLGEHPIQSFTEDSVAAGLARTLYSTIIDSLLSSHPWKFAQKQYVLTKTNENNFLIPSEVLRIINCGSIEYEIIGNRIFAETNSLKMTAIVQTGEEFFPSYFSQLAASKLAMEFCIPLTGDQNTFRTFAALVEAETSAAKLIDSSTASGNAIGNFSLISARY